MNTNISEEVLSKYETVVGLEVHAQLLTATKAYASDATEYGQMPNTQVSMVTMGYPGALPKFNEKVAEYAIKMGLACQCEITRWNIFDRKNYFYPDLPKGYQITQDKTPICTSGTMPIKTKSGLKKTIRIQRIHMEEDAGKSTHLEGSDHSLVDFNRAGVPLIEIVSEPDIRSEEEAYAYLTEIRRLVRYLDICDGNMEEGSLRADANVSVRLKGAKEYGKRVEVKNMNSFRAVQHAIALETRRQIALIEAGQTIVTETRSYDAKNGTTFSMRSKEGLNDYRYFPEPDLQPFEVKDEFLEQIKSEMPSLPRQLFHKFTTQYQLPEYDANVLIDNKEIALFFEQLCTKTENYKGASNWVMGPVKGYLNELTLHIDQFPLSTEKIAELIALVDSGKISFTIASQRLFPKMLTAPHKSAIDMAQELDLIQEGGEDFIKPLIQQVFDQSPDKVLAYKNGNKNLLGMFMGQVMKLGKGKVDPKKASSMIQEMLDS